MPNIVEDCGSIGGFLALARVNGVVRNVSLNRNRAWLICEAVVADAVHGQFISSKIEDLRDISFVLLAVLQAFKKTIAIGDFRSHPHLVLWVLGAPSRD